MSALRSTPKLKVHPLSVLHYGLFNIFAHSLHMEAVTPSTTWRPAMPRWEGPTYHGPTLFILLVCILYRVSQKSSYRDNDLLNCDYFRLLSFCHLQKLAALQLRLLGFLSTVTSLMCVVSLHFGSKYSCVFPWTTSIVLIKQNWEHPLLFCHLRLRLQNYSFTFLCMYLLPEEVWVASHG
jgi:hypothetical protein